MNNRENGGWHHKKWPGSTCVNDKIELTERGRIIPEASINEHDSYYHFGKTFREIEINSC